MAAYYKFRKRDLMKELEKLDDDDFIMINMGRDYPIIGLDDSTCIGYWELRGDISINFWDALENARKNNEL